MPDGTAGGVAEDVGGDVSVRGGATSAGVVPSGRTLGGGPCGGTAGVSYLKKATDITLFPELWDLRTEL